MLFLQELVWVWDVQAILTDVPRAGTECLETVRHASVEPKIAASFWLLYCTLQCTSATKGKNPPVGSLWETEGCNTRWAQQLSRAICSRNSYS